MESSDADNVQIVDRAPDTNSKTAVYQFQDYRRRTKELKRSRGEISCFECRRLKIKCDKKVPCSSCMRRRCEDICPNGPTMRAPAESVLLKVELGIAKERIRQLEEALQKAHQRLSDDPHPLLATDDVRRASARQNDEDAPSDSDDQDPLESFGTLTIAEGGESRFLGPSAASESLLIPDTQTGDTYESPSGSSKLPREVIQASQLWPFTPAYLTRQDHQSLLEANLPSYQRASALCEAFLENLAWLHSPILRTQLMEELIPTVYKRRPTSGNAVKPLEIHDLALALAVFACGAAGDLTQSPNNEEGNSYYTMARAALGVGASRNSVSAIQALILLSLYLRFSWSSDDLEESWRMLAIALGMSKAMGLHRDPGRWGLDPSVQERRRSVFWVIYLLDSYYALSNGRPPTFTSHSTDVKYPKETEADLISDGKKNPHYKYWRYEFLRRCLAPTTERFCNDTRPIKYREVLELDRKVLEYKAEESEHGERVRPGDPSMDTLLPLKQRLMQINCDTLRLQIHRNFFARAIIDHPENPTKSPFAPSFMTTFNMASSLLTEFHGYSEVNLPLLLRMWPYWLHLLVSGVVVGSVAARCPTFNLASSAFASLEVAILAFEQGIQHPVVANGLRVLKRLREKASLAMFEARQLPGGTNPKTTSHSLKTKGLEDDELVVLRGDSRLVSQKPTPSPSSSATNSRSSASPAHQTPSLPQEAYTYTPNIHGNMPMPLFGSIQNEDAAFPSGPQVDWTTMDIDAILAENDISDWFNSAAAGSVVDDGSFATLEPEAFPGPVPELSDPSRFPLYNAAAASHWSGQTTQSGTDGRGDWLF